jgi:hypothetical protein
VRHTEIHQLIQKRKRAGRKTKEPVCAFKFAACRLFEADCMLACRCNFVTERELPNIAE